MRFIYACMLVVMSLTIVSLVKNLRFTKMCIDVATKKIEELKQILDKYGKP